VIPVASLTALSASPTAPNHAAERSALAAEKGTAWELTATRYYRPLPNGLNYA
jgi:hypothetical protein